jgi:hypothetical protein
VAEILDNETWKTNVLQLCADSGGAMELRWWYAPGLIAAIEEGDPAALQAGVHLVQMLRTIKTQTSRKKLPWCLTCDTVFRKRTLPFVIAMLTPWQVPASAGLMNGVCVNCAECTPEELSAKMQAAYRKYLFPSLKVFDPKMVSAPGHS